MVAAVQDDHGNIRRVSGQCVRYDLPVDADEDRRPDAVAMGGDQIVEAGPLGLAARHPHERREGPHGRVRRVRVRCLRVIDPAHAVDLGHLRDAVPREPQVTEPLGHGSRRHPETAHQRRRRAGVGDVVRGVGPHVRDLREFQRGTVPLGDEGAVDDQAVHHTDHGDRGDTGGETDGAGPFRDLGLLHETFGLRFGHVVNTGVRDPFEDPCLVGHVAFVPAGSVVELEVVLVQVQHRRGVEGDGVHPVQLEAGQLDHQRVVGFVVEDGLHDGAADVPDRRRPHPGGPEHGLGHLGGGGLPVGAGDPEPRNGSVGLLHPPGEFDVPPHRDAALQRPGEQRGVGTPPRGCDHQVRVPGQFGGCSFSEPHRGVEGLQDGGLLGVGVRLVQDRDPCPEREQPVGRRVTRDAEARNDGVHPAPVTQPVRRQQELPH